MGDLSPWEKRVPSSSGRTGRSAPEQRIGGSGRFLIQDLLPPMLVITFQIIVGLALAAVGVEMLVHGASPVFVVPWLALLLVITVVNVRKQARRRQATRIVRDHTDNRGSSHRRH